MKHKVLLATLIPSVFALSLVTTGFGMFIWNTKVDATKKTVDLSANFEVDDNITLENQNIKMTKAKSDFKLGYEPHAEEGYNDTDSSNNNSETYYDELQRVYQVPVLKISGELKNDDFNANRLPYGFGVTETGMLAENQLDQTCKGKFISDNARSYWQNHAESFDTYNSDTIDYDKGVDYVFSKNWKYTSKSGVQTTTSKKEFYYPVSAPLLKPMYKISGNESKGRHLYRAFMLEDMYVTLQYKADKLFNYLTPKFYDTTHSKAIKADVSFLNHDSGTEGNPVWLKKDGTICDETDPDAVFCKNNDSFVCKVTLGKGYPLFNEGTGVKVAKPSDLDDSDVNKNLNTDNFLTLNKQYSASSIDGKLKTMVPSNDQASYGYGVMSDPQGPVVTSNALPSVTKQRLFGYTETEDSSSGSSTITATAQKTSNTFNTFISPISLNRDTNKLPNYASTTDGSGNKSCSLDAAHQNNWVTFRRLLGDTVSNPADGSSALEKEYSGATNFSDVVTATSMSVKIMEIGLAYKIVDEFPANAIKQKDAGNDATSLTANSTTQADSITFWNNYVAANTKYVKIFPTTNGDNWLHIEVNEDPTNTEHDVVVK